MSPTRIEPTSDIETPPPATVDHVTAVAVAERLHVTKHEVERASTVLSKTVTHEDHAVDTLVSHDDVTIERRPINVYVDVPPLPRVEGDTTIVPVIREVAVVTTRLLVVEEIRVTTRVVQTLDHQMVPLRIEHLDVERIERPLQGTSPSLSQSAKEVP